MLSNFDLNHLLTFPQFAMLTIVLICLLPFILPGIWMYMLLVLYVAFAQAYKGGQERLAERPLATIEQQ